MLIRLWKVMVDDAGKVGRGRGEGKDERENGHGTNWAQDKQTATL